MRKIKIDEISKDILNEEHCEDAENFIYLCAEANVTGALEFFDIAFNEDERTISIPDKIDFEESINIVNAYLEIVEAVGVADIKGAIDVPEDIVEVDDYIYRISKLAMRYDDHTRDSRGADDGTFDYAGTFVVSILCILQALSA